MTSSTNPSFGNTRNRHSQDIQHGKTGSLLLGQKALSEVFGNNRGQPARVGVDRGSECNFPIKRFALNSEGSNQRRILQSFFRKNGSAESRLNKFFDSLGVVGLHDYPQREFVLLHHGVDERSRAASS